MLRCRAKQVSAVSPALRELATFVCNGHMLGMPLCLGVGIFYSSSIFRMQKANKKKGSLGTFLNTYFLRVDLELWKEKHTRLGTQ